MSQSYQNALFDLVEKYYKAQLLMLDLPGSLSPARQCLQLVQYSEVSVLTVSFWCRLVF